MLLTSLPSERASAAEVVRLYRMRWQIELAFKRLKSLGGCARHLLAVNLRASRRAQLVKLRGQRLPVGADAGIAIDRLERREWVLKRSVSSKWTTRRPKGG